MKNSNRTCRECGEPFMGLKRHAAFCSTKCRKTWNNRRAVRGALLYDAFMAMRYERGLAKKLGLTYTFICRLGEMWSNAPDNPAGRSYRAPGEVMAETSAMVNSRMVGVDKTGRYG